MEKKERITIVIAALISAIAAIAILLLMILGAKNVSEKYRSEPMISNSSPNSISDTLQ